MVQIPNFAGTFGGHFEIAKLATLIMAATGFDGWHFNKDTTEQLFGP